MNRARLSQSVRNWSLKATWPPLLLATGALVIAALSSWVWLSIMGILGAGLLLVDMIARQRQFLAQRLSLRRAGGLSGEALARFRKARTAWCSRRAAMAAAHAEGFGEDSRRMVRSWGYKPWHVFPDRAFTASSPFLRLSFWRSVLGLSRL